MILDTIEMTAKKILVPNVMCKGEFHKLNKQKKTWSQNQFVTYQDLIPPYARNVHSSWVFYQKLSDEIFQHPVMFSKALTAWQQIQFRLLNNQLEQKDIDLIASLFKQRVFHPALYPLWFKDNPIHQNIEIMPYQWQPIEKVVFELNDWQQSTYNLCQISETHIQTSELDSYHQIQDHINEQVSTLIIVDDLNAYWLYNRSQLNAGIIDSIPLANHPNIQFLKQCIETVWHKTNPESLIDTKTFSLETHQKLNAILSNHLLNDIEHIIVKRFFKLLTEYNDDKTHTLATHIKQFNDWINAHQATVYENPSNVMITTPKHAFPQMYDHCISINMDSKALSRQFIRHDQSIHEFHIAQNKSYFKAKSAYHNEQKQSLNQSLFNVTDFARLQRCPIIYACQSKLKIKNEQASKLKMHLGIITHAVLADFWLNMKDQANLKKHAAWQIENMLKELVNKYIETIDKENSLDNAYWLFQQTHLTRTLTEWIHFESQRPSFKVVGVEQEIQLKFNDKIIKGRVDRIDYVEGLGHIIVDYKTGNPQSLQATLDGFPDPQMLIYTKAVKEQVIGIAYGLIQTKQLKGVQFSDPDYPDMAYADQPNIDAILETHIDLFNDVLKPEPFEPRHCIRCDFQSICHHASSSK